MVRYGETKLLFDAVESDLVVSDLFITHAHYDHARGFQFPVQKKYSTEETREIYEVESGRKVGNWQQVRRGRRVKVGEVEVEAHDAGHVLGSVQYEIITPEDNVVYTGHINFTDTYLFRAAEVAPCNILVIETLFSPPTQALPPRESVVADMVNWTLECIKNQRIPAFETDSIGNAQELVRIFNTLTEIPVILHPRIARISKVYEKSGIGLHYIDASTDEASKMIEDTRSIVIVPKRFDTTRFGNFRTAYVSGWATRIHDAESKVFLLSDQADFNQLLSYVQEARPKTVLTFQGKSELFAQLVSKRLGITARQLVTEIARKKQVLIKLDEKRIARCREVLLHFMQTPGFAYQKDDLLALGLKEGFRSSEVEETLLRLTRDGVLKYSELLDAYKLSKP